MIKKNNDHPGLSRKLIDWTIFLLDWASWSIDCCLYIGSTRYRYALLYYILDYYRYKVTLICLRSPRAQRFDWAKINQLRVNGSREVDCDVLLNSGCATSLDFWNPSINLRLQHLRISRRLWQQFWIRFEIKDVLPSCAWVAMDVIGCPSGAVSVLLPIEVAEQVCESTPQTVVELQVISPVEPPASWRNSSTRLAGCFPVDFFTSVATRWPFCWANRINCLWKYLFVRTTFRFFLIALVASNKVFPPRDIMYPTQTAELRLIPRLQWTSATPPVCFTSSRNRKASGKSVRYRSCPNLRPRIRGTRCRDPRMVTRSGRVSDPCTPRSLKRAWCRDCEVSGDFRRRLAADVDVVHQTGWLAARKLAELRHGIGWLGVKYLAHLPGEIFFLLVHDDEMCLKVTIQVY